MTGKQKKAMDLLFGGATEAEVIEKCGGSRGEYESWWEKREWGEEVDRRLVAARRRSEVVIAGNREKACETLIGLMSCEKEQTARQACLDVINMPVAGAGGVEEELGKRATPGAAEVDGERAGEILRIATGGRE